MADIKINLLPWREELRERLGSQVPVNAGGYHAEGARPLADVAPHTRSEVVGPRLDLRPSTRPVRIDPRCRDPVRDGPNEPILIWVGLIG